MEIVDRKPAPIYEVVCHECGSKIRYTAAEVAWCHITCPVCGVGVWADTICPVATEVDAKNYPPYLDYPKERKKQTNADKYFRNATDEELAKRLSKQNFWNCPPHEETGPTICHGRCRNCWLEWLKQEVSDE